MAQNNNLSPLPFYDSKDKQEFRRWYSYGDIYPYIASSQYLVPFFVSNENNIISIDNVEFFSACCGESSVLGSGTYSWNFASPFSATHQYYEGEYAGLDGSVYQFVMDHLGAWSEGDVEYRGDVYNIYGYQLKNAMSFYNGASSSVMYYSGNGIVGLPTGAYYIKITFTDSLGSGKVRYSEVFFAEDVSKKVSIKWYNADDLEFDGGFIPYNHTANSLYYSNRIYLDTHIGLPEYSYTEEGEERNGRFFPVKQISEKTYKFVAIVPEFVCDLMRTIRMSDVMTIYDNELGNTYNLEQFETDVKWLDGGRYAKIECSFQTNTIVKKIGKAYSDIISR